MLKWGRSTTGGTVGPAAWWCCAWLVRSCPGQSGPCRAAWMANYAWRVPLPHKQQQRTGCGYHLSHIAFAKRQSPIACDGRAIPSWVAQVLFTRFHDTPQAHMLYYGLPCKTWHSHQGINPRRLDICCTHLSNSAFSQSIQTGDKECRWSRAAERPGRKLTSTNVIRRGPGPRGNYDGRCTACLASHATARHGHFIAILVHH